MFKALFLWSGCTTHATKDRTYPRDIFWIKAPVDLLKSSAFLDQIIIPDPEYQKGPCWVEDETIDGYCYLFAPASIREDDKPWLGWRVFPYSGMHGTCNPLIAIGPRTKSVFNEPEGIAFKDLRDLSEIRNRIRFNSYIHINPLKK